MNIAKINEIKFWRPDTRILIGNTEPVDRNHPEKAFEAVEYELPTSFSDKAKLFWDYLDGTGFLYEYEGHLVVTDESLYLTDHGDGTRRAPYGGPRWTGENWEELERWLEAGADDLDEYERLTIG